MTTQCAWCRKIRMGKGWVRAIPIGIVSHGICPACTAELDRRFRRRTVKDRKVRADGRLAAV